VLASGVSVMAGLGLGFMVRG